MIGIYKITNLINDNFYIGLSNDIERRIAEHKTPKNIKNKNTILAKAFRKYGIDNFKFEIIEECPIEKLAEREMYYIEKMKPIYNMNLGGEGNLGHKVNDDMKKLLSEKAKIQWNNKSEEEKLNIINNNLKGPKIGHKVSDETRKKLRKANLNKIQSEETKKKRSIINKEKMKGNTNGNKSVVAIDKATGDIVKSFESIKLAGEFYNVHSSCITNVLKGKRKSTCGYYWKYAKDL